MLPCVCNLWNFYLIFFPSWGILSIAGIIWFAVIHFWILLGISIASLILCVVVAAYAFIKYVLDSYGTDRFRSNHGNDLILENRREENDLNNSRDTNYSDKPDNQILGEQIIIEERDDNDNDNDNDKFLVYNE